MSRRDYFKEEDKLKKISIVFGVTLVLTIIVFSLIFNMYNKKLKESARKSILELGSVNTVVPNTNNLGIASVSTSEDKNIEDVKQEENVVEIKKQEVAKHIQPEENQTEDTVINEIKEEKKEENIIVEPEPLTFIAPLNGEIVKDFASETLVYSETLQEWTVHNGIDIKAPKTTVVVSSAEGIVESIKNDPRYGLTITIAHRDGFKTIYSNLLTAEFVTEGQEVEQGRTIGTVGETASFEAIEDAHLHFEMTKDGLYINPTLYFN